MTEKLNIMILYLQMHNSSCVSRSCSMKIGTTMSTAFAVSAVTAHLLMSPSPARMMLCSATTVTAMNSLPNVSPVTRRSCLVRTHNESDILFQSTRSTLAGLSIDEYEELEAAQWCINSIGTSQLQDSWFNSDLSRTVRALLMFV